MWCFSEGVSGTINDKIVILENKMNMDLLTRKNKTESIVQVAWPETTNHYLFSTSKKYDTGTIQTKLLSLHCACTLVSHGDAWAF